MKKIKNNNKGFSLVELIVVIAIMAVLMGVLAPQFLRYVEKSRAQRDASAVGEVLNATKIAMADSTIASAVDSATNKVVTISSTGAVTTSVTELTTELGLVTGTNLAFNSTTFKSITSSITITIAGSTSAGYTFTVANVPSPYNANIK